MDGWRMPFPSFFRSLTHLDRSIDRSISQISQSSQTEEEQTGTGAPPPSLPIEPTQTKPNPSFLRIIAPGIYFKDSKWRLAVKAAKPPQRDEGGRGGGGGRRGEARLFVGGLPENVTETDLLKKFKCVRAV